MRNAGKIALGTAMMALAGCARETAVPPPPRAPVQLPAPSPSPAAPLSPASYIATAASIDLFEIRSAELALQRSASNRVREFAGMMINAHRGTSAQLSLAGRRLNLLPSARLHPAHEAMLADLASAADFDGAYRRQQRTVHEQALTLHRNFAARGASPTLRPVAAAAASVVERHLRLLQIL